MKIVELRKKTKGQLEKLLLQRQERLRNLRFDLASGRVKNVREIRHLKREVARILTTLQETRDKKPKKSQES